MDNAVVRQTIVRAALALPLVASSIGCWGCAVGNRTIYRADRYYIEADLVPAEHRLVGRAQLDLARVDHQPVRTDAPISFELLLHPDLRIQEITADGCRVRHWTAVKTVEKPDGNGFTPRTYSVVLNEAVDTLTLSVTYSGTIVQDPNAGEKPGEIHNFEMRAHIGPEGIYLADGNWYPQPFSNEGSTALSDFTLVAYATPEFELVAGADPDPKLSEETGRAAWRSPYPIDKLVLVGGRHDVHRRDHHGVMVELHLTQAQADQAEGLFDAVARNLDRYEPLIGDYPAGRFAIVDNFFSSGFAFPTFTLLSSAVINMGERSQTTHGYIDHEMLHCWWGNGIAVDPGDGNWCEALASYGANYYGHILDGNEEEARRKRRNYSHFLSRLEPEKDKPLGTFGREDGCGRGIAYEKGAAVFHMLARKIGQDRFWAAMRRFTDEYVGRPASWNDIRRLCEEVSGTSLETFFRQWIRSGGAPALRIDHARYDSTEQALTIGIAQDEPAFELGVPVRVAHEGGTIDIELPLHSTFSEITVPIDVIPMTVEIDPDYHLFRKVPLPEVLPTTASTRYGKAFISILPAGEVAERYRTARTMFERDFEQDEVRSVTAGQLADGDLAESCVLVLGDAARDATVAAFLSAIEFPLQWEDNGFVFENEAYTDSAHAILATVAHPGVSGGGVTLLFANSDAAIPSPMNVLFYDQSVVIFQDGKPILRRDLEHRTSVSVDRS